MAPPSVRTKHWTRLEYERLVDLGAFRPGARLELVDGMLLVREPQGSPHATAVGLVEDALRQAFGAGWTVRTHSPIALDDDSEPEPDLAVVAGSRREHRHAHPSRPVLIVEVADSSQVLGVLLRRVVAVGPAAVAVAPLVEGETSRQRAVGRGRGTRARRGSAGIC